jgi:large subunit ribosomal protein L9
MKQQLLLLEDVDALGRKGEIVTAKPGYIRNYLLPRSLAMVATPNTLKKQERLRKEREEQAVIDRRQATEMAAQLEKIALEINVKVDPEGHMYGSVNAAEVAELIQAQGMDVTKKNVQLTKPLKKTGEHKITLKLKEEVTVTCLLNLIPEGNFRQEEPKAEEPAAPQEEEESTPEE